MKKCILVAVDFSNATPDVVAAAVAQAKAFQLELRLFHAVEPEPSYTAYGFTPEEFPALCAFQDEARRRAENKLADLLAQVQLEIPAATSEIVHGSPLRMLLEAATHDHAAMVVLGSHGHGVIASLLLGSVAEGMVRKASVPTLIIPVRAD